MIESAQYFHSINQKISSQLVGEFVGQFVAERAPGMAYAVAPLTVAKFNWEPAQKRAREEIHRARPGARVVAGDATGAACACTANYTIATATKLKGTERSRVVVFGADIDYDLMLSRTAFIKRLFVALSRARDELVIVLRTRITPVAYGVLAPALRLALPSTRAPSRALHDGHKPVRAISMRLVEDLAECGAVRIGCAAWPRPPPPLLAIPIFNDADFVGEYAEALVADALGLMLLTRIEVRIHDLKTGQRESTREIFTRVVAPDGEPMYIIECGAAAAPAVRARVAATYAAAAGRDPAYGHCLLKFCATIGTVWTVSERLAHTAAEYAPRAAAIAGWLRTEAPGAEWHWGATGEWRAASTRHADTASDVLVHFTPDFIAVSGGQPAFVLELKHVSALTDAHRRQASAYALFTGAPRTLLLNVGANGSAETIAPPASADFARAVRAVAALRAGRSAATRRSTSGPAADFAGVASPPGFTPACVIALDIETAGALVTEVGAVVLSAVDWRLLGTYSEVAPGVVAGRRAPAGSAARRVEDITGLAVDDAHALTAAQPAMRQRLLDFAQTFAPAGARTWVTYGGGDAAWLGEPTVDVLHRLFRPWRERVGGNADAAPLELAARLAASTDGFGCLFVPHVAFEDAIATAAVLAATLRTDGAL